MKGRKFFDSLRLFVKGGAGGNGLPKYGGIGGKGGDVFAEGVEAINLFDTKKSAVKVKQCFAGNGDHSHQHRLIGDAGKDLTIPIPCGTSVHSDGGHVLGEVLSAGEKILVCRGGAGGDLTNKFIGQRGQEHHIRFFLKLIADVGLVGFPNAGKSTLLRAISRAKPKVANYPFTTLHPIIGVINYNDERTISMADLPGLIEGAWNNTGMGHKFLRHVERTKILVFVVDIQGFRLGPQYPYRSAIENIILLNKELELYKPELVEKPSFLLLNKMDKPNATEKLRELKSQLKDIKGVSDSLPEEMRPERFVKFEDIVTCSAKYDKKSVVMVKDRIRFLLDMCTSQEEDLENVHKKIRSDLYETQLRLI